MQWLSATEYIGKRTGIRLKLYDVPWSPRPAVMTPAGTSPDLCRVSRCQRYTLRYVSPSPSPLHNDRDRYYSLSGAQGRSTVDYRANLRSSLFRFCWPNGFCCWSFERTCSNSCGVRESRIGARTAKGIDNSHGRPGPDKESSKIS